MRVAFLGKNSGVALELTRWLVEHWTLIARAGRFDASTFDMMLGEMGDSEQTLACAKACESLWNQTPHVACMHVAGHGKSPLFQADLVFIDGADSSTAEECLAMLELQLPFLCPDAVVVVHDHQAALDDELDMLMRAPDSAPTVNA